MRRSKAHPETEGERERFVFDAGAVGESMDFARPVFDDAQVSRGFLKMLEVLDPSPLRTDVKRPRGDDIGMGIGKGRPVALPKSVQS
jgi:hypothetical protein